MVISARRNHRKSSFFLTIFCGNLNTTVIMRAGLQCGCAERAVLSLPRHHHGSKLAVPSTTTSVQLADFYKIPIFLYNNADRENECYYFPFTSYSIFE